MIQEKLNELASKARKEDIPVMVSETAGFIATFCAKHKPKNILEIGTAVGYSGLVMLLNSGEESMLTTIEKDEKRFLRAKHNFQSYDIEPRTMQYLGDAGEILPWLEGEFDLIFLDGPKGQYKKYLPTLLKLLKVDGYMLADDVDFHGKVSSGEYPEHKHRTMIVSLREFIKQVEENDALESEFKDIGEGLLIVHKTK